MNAVAGWDGKVSFIWSVADLLRGDFKAHEYGQIILPFTVLRRLECALAPTKADVVKKAAALADIGAGRDAMLRRVSGHRFYNTSALDLTNLLNDPGNVGKNLQTYLAGFSPSAFEVLEAYRFPDKIVALDKAGLTYKIVAKFAELDLSEKAVPNQAMGYVFEELIRRFSEMSNETAGEHFTPREVIDLMVNLLLVDDRDALTGKKPVRTLYDCAAGTGGMLSGGQVRMHELNPDAVLEVYGQEINPESWAICRSDLMIKNQDPSRIVYGNSLTADDGHAEQKFDYLLSNPPFGVDWKKYADPVKAEHENLGQAGRYGPGLPRVSDGSLLFLMHMLSKMKPVKPDGSGGTRLAIVFSGSPLFAGAAGGGESEIRRWIIENDWLEGIVALPDQMFYNTGISTYFWILSNRKRIEREGKVALVDARQSFEKMRKSLGDKRKYLTALNIHEIVELYENAVDPELGDKRVKVFDRETFGYQRITVERPMRRRWVVGDEALELLALSKAWIKESGSEEALSVFAAVRGTEYATEKECAKAVSGAADVPANVVKELVKLAAVPAPDAPVIADRKGDPLPDPDLRDAENIPLPEGFIDLPEHQQTKVLVEQAERHLVDEIRPYAEDAWIDHAKTKIGYELPFTRHFYEYVPPRPVAEIDAALAETERQIQELLGGLKR